MEKITLNAVTRNAKESPNKVRREGLIPAVIYGHNIASTHVAVNLIQFEKVLKKAGENTVVELIDDKGDTYPVLIHDVQKHYLKSRPIHADFLKVNMNEVVHANVPVEFVGTAPAVKSLNGTLVKVLSDIQVESLPADIPHSLEVDISSLEDFNSSVKVADIKVPANVKILADPEEVVAKVQPPRNLEKELEATVEDVSKVEVISKPETEEEAPAEENKKE